MSKYVMPLQQPMGTGFYQPAFQQYGQPPPQPSQQQSPQQQAGGGFMGWLRGLMQQPRQQGLRYNPATDNVGYGQGAGFQLGRNLVNPYGNLGNLQATTQPFQQPQRSAPVMQADPYAMLRSLQAGIPMGYDNYLRSVGDSELQRMQARKKAQADSRGYGR